MILAMASSITEEGTPQLEGDRKGLVLVAMEEEEEEEDLFEIDIHAVYSIPSPKYHRVSYFPATATALLANCLLPIADLSSAVPVAFTLRDQSRGQLS
ncbi:hypothetical protein OIU85_015055 [Salix viminalis]|uniref:Uncharacterized protein n=1 Tax=Salix viminalis TaxID=40686 RepID=A0A9Q0NK04_SALVM|nr:hypothetical protein OIU85_015055 [Salix viminalis]